MKSFFISFISASVMLSASAFAGPSAKFAAVYTTGLTLGELVSESTASGSVDVASDFDTHSGYTLATIKVPQDKELLVGVSSEVGLVTDTSIKGKNGGAAKAIADARANVVVFAVPTGNDANIIGAKVAKPGLVTLSKRVQTLDATLGGVLESCEDGSADGIIDGKIDIKTECLVSDEEIGLILDTLASHHFNFVLPNMDSGEYDIVAFFTTETDASINIDEATVTAGGTISATANAKAFIGKTMVTVQQVHAAKGGIVNAEVITIVE